MGLPSRNTLAPLGRDSTSSGPPSRPGTDGAMLPRARGRSSNATGCDRPDPETTTRRSLRRIALARQPHRVRAARHIVGGSGVTPRARPSSHTRAPGGVERIVRRPDAAGGAAAGRGGAGAAAGGSQAPAPRGAAGATAALLGELARHGPASSAGRRSPPRRPPRGGRRRRLPTSSHRRSPRRDPRRARGRAASTAALARSSSLSRRRRRAARRPARTPPARSGLLAARPRAGSEATAIWSSSSGATSVSEKKSSVRPSATSSSSARPGSVRRLVQGASLALILKFDRRRHDEVRHYRQLRVTHGRGRQRQIAGLVERKPKRARPSGRSRVRHGGRQCLGKLQRRGKPGVGALGERAGEHVAQPVEIGAGQSGERCGRFRSRSRDAAPPEQLVQERRQA